MKKRIALVCNSSRTMVNFRLATMRALRDFGYELTLIAPDDGGRAAVEAEGIAFVPWSVSWRGTNPLREITAIRYLGRILASSRFSLVFAYTIKAAIYCSLLAPFTRIPTVAVITGLGFVFIDKSLKSILIRGLYTIALRHAHDVWFLNGDDRALFQTRAIVRKGMGKLMPGEGVGTVHFSPAPRRAQDGKTVFLLLSRLLKDKGAGEYFMAAARIHPDCPNLVFRVAGALDESGAGAVRFEDIVRYQAEGIVEYYGMVADVRPLIADADFVVLPSYREGLPRCLLEAASMERPLIATDVPGCREIAIEGQTGILVQPRDIVSLVDGFKRAMKLDAESAKAMGKRGRILVTERFSDERVIEFYREKILNIMELRHQERQCRICLRS